MAIKVRRSKLYPPIELAQGLELGLDEIEWERIVDRLGRNPNHFEASIFAALWSEEVSSKSASALLQSIEREQPQVTRIDGSELGFTRFTEEQYLTLRIVNNNQQSGLEPFYGTQTAINQSLSELSSIGAIPLGVLNLLRLGSFDTIKQQHLFQAAVDGIGHFCSRFGLPVLGGDLYFHQKFNRSTMVNSGIVGLLSSDAVPQPQETPFQSPVLYIGAATGRDGLRSRRSAPTGKRNQTRLTLKMSDPLLSNRIINACSEAIHRGIIRDLITVGAGGLAVACFNLSKRIKRPILLDIDRIPLRTKEMEPLDIILSESSERVLIIANKDQHRALNEVLYKWDLDSIKVGEVNDSDGLEFYWNHYQAADIPFLFALGGSVQKKYEVVKFPPMLKRSAKGDSANKTRQKKRKVEDEWSLVREVSLTKSHDSDDYDLPCPSDLDDVWLDLLANPNLCSRNPVYRLFDQVVGARTFQRPGGDAAVLRMPNNSGEPPSGIALTLDSSSLYVNMEPYLGTVQTIAEGMRNLAAVGAKPIGLSYCFNFGDPEKYQDICSLAEAIRGLGDATNIWKIPILSSQISLFNGTEGNPCLPTPSILCAGKIKNLKKSCSTAFRAKGDTILLLGLTQNEIGCTEYASYIHKSVNRLVPDIDFDLEQRCCDLVIDLIEQGLLASAHDISSGGLAIALTESCMTRKVPIGATFNIYPQTFQTPNGPIPLRADAALFSETSARFIVSCTTENLPKVELACQDADIPITGKGTVGGKNIIIEGAANTELPLSTTYKLWIHRLESLLGQGGKETSGF